MALSAIAALLSLGAIGCQEFERPSFNRREGANDAPLLVVPFREPSRHLWYGESPRGNRLAEHLKRWARENALSPVILEGDDVTVTLERVRDWTQGDLRTEDWKRLTTGLGARFVVEGEIQEPKLRSERVVGLYDAELTAKFRVLDVVNGRVAFESTAQGKYGGGEASLDMITDVPDRRNDAAVEERLLRALAEQIGKELYGSYVD